MPSLPPLLAKLATGASLSKTEAKTAFEIVMSGEATPSQIGALLMGMRVRGETVDEIAGAAIAMRDKAITIDAPPNAIDTAGTGGDGIGTLNISTCAALVAAGCGVPVAKHGNRAISSKSGSADVLKTLGVNIEASMELIRESLWSIGIGFFMAPRHHGAMRHVAPTRIELGTRTIFNLLGPLSNPAGTTRQLVGVFDSHWCVPLAEVLGSLGSSHVWVVHGTDGMDELTTTGPSLVAAFKDGSVTTFEVTPEDANVPRSRIEDLIGGDPEFNAREIRELLDGKPGPYRDIVVMNTAAALVVAGKANSLSDGASQAVHAIVSGKASSTLSKLIEITNREAIITS
ncbi:MAG TPA: anthranilate phosphoribosyltransferase [Alphaproteobacteria bacterium]|nr:anthranilate phosphoribosyltransferase [Alphaproteobacteria bacterium]